MRKSILWVLIVISGCNRGPSGSTAPAVAIQMHYPVVAGEVELVVGDGHETIAPPGSATAGSKWIEHDVTYTNLLNHPIWVSGYSESSLFSRIETRSNDAAEWRDYGLGYCGTGARDLEIAPRASYSFTASLPEKYIGEEFRVFVLYRTVHTGDDWFQAASQGRLLANSPAGD